VEDIQIDGFYRIAIYLLYADQFSETQPKQHNVQTKRTLNKVKQSNQKPSSTNKNTTILQKIDN